MKYIYSHSLDDIVLKAFYYKGKHYTWNDIDCVYYDDDTEENYFMDVPFDN